VSRGERSEHHEDIQGHEGRSHAQS
jgi:hypothetical protein